MGILFWYIFRQFAKIFLMCMTAVLAVYLIVDFFEKLRIFLKYDAELSTMLAYFFFRMPDIVFLLAPLAALMATILTLSMLNKNLEITAMRSCGMSMSQVAAPFMAMAVILTVLLFSFTAVIIPLSNLQAQYIRTVLIEKKPKPLSVVADHLWIRLGPQNLLEVKTVEPKGTVLRHIHLYRLSHAFQLDEILEADSAQYTSKGWVLTEVIKHQVTPAGQVRVLKEADSVENFPLTPEDFRTWLSVDTKNMTLRQLRAYIDRLKHEGHNSDRYATDYWGRIAFSTVTMVMILLGLALSLLSTGRRGVTVGKGIGQALGVGFVFWVAYSLGIALGRNGAILPIVGGWVAVIMLLAASLNLFLKVK